MHISSQSYFTVPPKYLGVELTDTMRLFNSCAAAKGFRYPFASPTTNGVKTNLKRINVDLVIPWSMVTNEGKRHARMLRDYFSCYDWMYLLASEQDTPVSLAVV